MRAERTGRFWGVCGCLRSGRRAAACAHIDVEVAFGGFLLLVYLFALDPPSPPISSRFRLRRWCVVLVDAPGAFCFSSFVSRLSHGTAGVRRVCGSRDSDEVLHRYPDASTPPSTSEKVVCVRVSVYLVLGTWYLVGWLVFALLLMPSFLAPTDRDLACGCHGREACFASSGSRLKCSTRVRDMLSENMLLREVYDAGWRITSFCVVLPDGPLSCPSCPCCCWYPWHLYSSHTRWGVP